METLPIDTLERVQRRAIKFILSDYTSNYKTRLMYLGMLPLMQIYEIADTVEPLLKDTPNKGHNTFDLSVKDKFCGLYRTMAIQY